MDPELGDMAPEYCDVGTYCLPGTAGKVIDDMSGDSPRKCVEGTFCGAGVTSPEGSSCPIGHYCPRGTSIPKKAPLGFFVAQKGAVLPIKCKPGTYADEEGLTECKLCPAGSQCALDQTIVPETCPPGTYRSYLEN